MLLYDLRNLQCVLGLRTQPCLIDLKLCPLEILVADRSWVP